MSTTKTYSLEIILQEFIDELNAIQEYFDKGKAYTPIEHPICDYSPLSDGCVVSLWDAWSRCLRSLFLHAAAGPTRGTEGAVYQPLTPRPEAEALLQLAAVGAPRSSGIALNYPSKEPKWYLTKHSLAIATALDLDGAQAQIISNALTVSIIPLSVNHVISSPVKYIQDVRNYIAHKSVTNRDYICTEHKLPEIKCVDSLLRTRTPGSSTLFQDWKDALIEIVRQATK